MPDVTWSRTRLGPGLLDGLGPLRPEASTDGTIEGSCSSSGLPENVIDDVHAEWNNNAAAFVGYGSAGGTGTVEHLRGITGGLPLT